MCVTDVGIRSRRVQAALIGHLGTKPYLEGLLQCLTFLAARKSFLVFYLNNSYCNFIPPFLSLFTGAMRTGLSASSDPITFMINSAIKLSFPSLLLPCAKGSLPTGSDLNLDEAPSHHIK